LRVFGDVCPEEEQVDQVARRADGDLRGQLRGGGAAPL